MKEFLLGIKTIAGYSFIFSDGGYFRLCPHTLSCRLTKETSGHLKAYIHPRDRDSGQLMSADLSLACKFKSYVDLLDHRIAVGKEECLQHDCWKNV